MRRLERVIARSARNVVQGAFVAAITQLLKLCLELFVVRIGPHSASEVFGGLCSPLGKCEQITRVARQQVRTRWVYPKSLLILAICRLAEAMRTMAKVLDVKALYRAHRSHGWNRVLDEPQQDY